MMLLAQATLVPPLPPHIQRIGPQIILLGLLAQDLRLLRQTRHVREARRPAARTHTYEAFLCFPMQGLRADVARLALRVVRARLDGLRDGLLVFFVCIILFCVAAAVDPFTNLLVAAAPVVMLASRITISCPAIVGARGFTSSQETGY